MTTQKAYEELPYPTFLSLHLLTYLDKISEQAGREFVFVDGRTEGSQDYLGRAFVSDEGPVAGIVVTDPALTPSGYSRADHDPIIAHEATHIALHTEGWPIIDWSELQHVPQIQFRMNTVTNWLQDPVIDARLHNLGFSMTAHMRTEIQESITAIRTGRWIARLRMLAMQGPAQFYRGQIQVIRFYVRNMLEPNIPPRIKEQFRQAFETELRTTFPEANRFLECIQGQELNSPDEFTKLVRKCCDIWKIDADKLQFLEMEKFTVQERERLLAMKPEPTVSWE